MYSYFNGIVDSISSNGIVIDVNGVGYNIIW